MVDYIKNGEDMDLWSNGRIVYQVKTKNGPIILFESAVTAKKEQEQMVVLFLGFVSIIGLLWSIRQIKLQRAKSALE